MGENSDSKIIIGGKTLLVSSSTSLEQLQRIADYVNGKISECSNSRGYDKMAMDTRNMLLLLNIGEDYITTKEKCDRLMIELAERNKELYEVKQDLAKLRSDYVTARSQVSELQGRAAENAAKMIRLEKELKKK